MATTFPACAAVDFHGVVRCIPESIHSDISTISEDSLKSFSNPSRLSTDLMSNWWCCESCDCEINFVTPHKTIVLFHPKTTGLNLSIRGLCTVNGCGQINKKHSIC